ncbi:alpha/beta fold hydrolase [Nonomuraea antimicrobica]
MHVSPVAARHLFYDDCPAEPAEAAIARLTPEHVATVGSPVTRAAWTEAPSAYIVTAKDRAISPTAQRAMAERAGRRYEIDSGHSPTLTRPDELAALLARAIREAAPHG